MIKTFLFALFFSFAALASNAQRYAIIDSKLGNIGNITDVDEKTDNAIIKVIHPSGKEIILPFNDDLIIEIDDDLKIIEFNAPEGLIEMYLQS